MGIVLPRAVVMQVDNTQALSFQHQTCPNSKLKGIFDLREAWVQELRDQGEVITVKVSTEKNIADLLTKCLVNTDFNRLVQLSQCHNPRKLELVRAKSKVSL